MELSEYSQRQHSLAAQITRLILRFLFPFKRLPASEAAWNVFLRSSFPEVERLRNESARLGREFYDSERAKALGDTEPHEFILPEYKFEWYQASMEGAKDKVLRPNTQDDDLAFAAQLAAREVENGGRRAVLRPIREEEFQDPQEPRWARVATGRETCGFCLMLISRGPVYFSAENAGLDLDDTSALEVFNSGDEEYMKEHMNEWHTGCDCKVVPVFDKSSWAGRDAYLKAEQFYKDIARKVAADEETKIRKAGNQHARKGSKRNRGEAIVNEMRKALQEGSANMTDFAAAA